MATENTTIETEEPKYATAEDVLAIKAPEPLSEDYFDTETQLTYRIEGFRGRHKKMMAVEDATELAERIATGKLIVRDLDGKEFMPTAEQILMAILASKCVVKPKLGELQWLAASDVSDLLDRLFLRILICNLDLSIEQLNDAIEASETEDQQEYAK